MSGTLLMGVISDTHGTVPLAVHAAFAGVDHIIHAGDIGGAAVLLELEAIAPVLAVLGNTDVVPYPAVQPRAKVTLAGCVVEVLHNITDLRRAPLAADACVVIYGHTHLPHIGRRGCVLEVNPGSAAHPRGGHGPTVALLSIERGTPSARLVRL